MEILCFQQNLSDEILCVTQGSRVFLLLHLFSDEIHHLFYLKMFDQISLSLVFTLTYREGEREREIWLATDEDVCANVR